MALSDGEAFVDGSILSFQQGNRMLFNFRQGASPANPSAGLLHSDSDDEELYLYDGAAWKRLYQQDRTDVAVTDGGTGRSTSTTAYGLLAAGTLAANPHQTLPAGLTTELLVGGGAAALPAWTTATGTGAPVRAGSPTFTTKITTPIIDLTGGQIAFPAIAVPSADPNTLDDYEEGTWTPSIGGTSTYNNQDGEYTLIGDLFSFNMRMHILLIGTGSTSVVSGLPFACNVGKGDHPAPLPRFSNLALNVVYICGKIADNTATLTFSTLAAAAASYTNAAAIFQNNAEVHCGGSYKIA